MAPAVVLSILSVFILLVCVTVGMPLGGFVFYHEVKDFIVNYARHNYGFHIRDFQPFFMSLWGIGIAMLGMTLQFRHQNDYSFSSLFFFFNSDSMVLHRSLIFTSEIHSK